MAQRGAGEVLGGDIKKLYEQKYKFPEVLFPGRFTGRRAWTPDAGYVPAPTLSTTPIEQLSHITHDTEADAISPHSDQDGYIFKPKPRLGRAYLFDGSPLGETYRENGIDSELYRKIPRDSAPVFPGYLSWWGVNMNKAGSGYGNNAFIISLSDILDDYQKARAHGTDRVCLKVGGTLRYRHEICYVVVVCMEGELDDMPIVDENNEVFDHRGLLDTNGVVVDRSKTPQATTTDKTSGYSWENVAFGFYFPEQQQQLVCAANNIEWIKVRHDPENCLKKKPRKKFEKSMCPNLL